MAKKWIRTAINPAHKGEFREKAEHAGESTHAYAEEKKSSPGKLGRQARLALVLSGMHHGSDEGHKRVTAKTARHALYGEKK